MLSGGAGPAAGAAAASRRARRWPRAVPGAVPLPPGAVQVWRVALDRPPAEVRRLRGLLDPEELARCDAMVRRVDREHRIVARAALRLLLAARLGVAPRRVRLGYGRAEKPFLDPAHGACRPRFNLSHSGGLALVAVSADREVGVDLERLRPGLDVDRLAARFFSARERSDLARTPPARRDEAFFRIWTHKEAYLKARGEGLRHPLDRFSVDSGASRRPRLTENALHPADVGRWSFRSLAPSAGYVGAVVVEGRLAYLRRLDWAPLRTGA